MSTPVANVSNLEKESQGEKESVKAHATILKANAHRLNFKEQRSAYFTIAAAAFGLVSDGCK